MKKKKIIIITIILTILGLYIIYVNLPKLFKTKNGEIVITDPAEMLDIALYSSGSGLFENIYQGNQPTHIIIYSNGLVIEKNYSTGNYKFLPDFLEKTEDMKVITKISRKEVKEIREELMNNCEKYNEDYSKLSNESILDKGPIDFLTYRRADKDKIEIKNDENVYVFNEISKEILEKYNVNIYLNNHY